MKKDIKFELKRNVFHLLFGCLLAVMLLTLGKNYSLYLFGGCIIAGIVISEMIRFKIKVLPFYWLVKYFGRKKERPGMGAINFFIGAFIALVYFDVSIVFIGLLILAFDDSFSAIFGIAFGRHKIRKNKTFEGFLAGFIASFLICLLFIPAYIALVACLIAAIIEIYAFLDDNILIIFVTSFVITLLI